jgi:hypothetical protein
VDEGEIFGRVIHVEKWDRITAVTIDEFPIGHGETGGEVRFN